MNQTGVRVKVGFGEKKDREAELGEKAMVKEDRKGKSCDSRTMLHQARKKRRRGHPSGITINVRL